MKNIQKKTYGNGLTLIAEQRPDTRKAALFVGVGAGSVDEDSAINGGSHFNEHLLFKSNPNRTARQIIEDLEYSGSIVNACTTWKYTGFYAKTPEKSLGTALEILYEAATNYDYDEKEFELERQVILTEIDNYINAPDKHALTGLFVPALFEGTSVEQKIEGTAASMKKVKKTQLEAYKKRLYVPNNMIIAVSGRYDWKKLDSLVGASFGTLRKSPVPKRKPVSVSNKKRFAEEKRNDLSQSYLHLGYRVPGYGASDYFALDMLSSILSEGMSSRMFHELRERRGIGYSVGNFYYPNGEEGMFVSHVDGFDPKKLSETKDTILSIFRDLKKNLVSPKEFAGTKALMLSRYDDVLERITERAMMMYLTEFFQIPYDFREKEKYVRAVSREDVRAAAKEYLGDDYTLTLLAPKKI